MMVRYSHLNSVIASDGRSSELVRSRAPKKKLNAGQGEPVEGSREQKIEWQDQPPVVKASLDVNHGKPLATR